MKQTLCIWGHFASASWVLQEYLTRKMSWFSVFKGQTVTIFQKLPIFLFRTTLNPKHYFLQNLNQNSRAFIFETHLRYVLTLFIFLIFRLSLRFYNFYGWVILEEVGKTLSSCQNFLIFLIGFCPIVFVLPPSGILTCI